MSEKKEKKELKPNQQNTPVAQDTVEPQDESTQQNIPTAENTVEPQDISAPQEQSQVDMKTIEQWAFDLRIPSWQLAALKKANNYAIGKQITEYDFKKALDIALNKKF